MQDRVGMDAPGLSLFQGSDSIQINPGIHRQEEDEEQEDIKRRDEEIKNLMTNAFDDLEDDDDASSMASSRFHDTSRDVDHSDIRNCSIQPAESEKGPTISQYQNDYSSYACDESSIYKTTPYPHIEGNKGTNASDIHNEYGVYGQIGTPLNNNKEHSLHSILESPYESPMPLKAINSAFPHDLRTHINDGLTLLENYPHNYHTPSNHYDGHNKKYSNNGYFRPYENNISQDNSQEMGGGDHESGSEHYKHCYKTSPNGRPTNDTNAYKSAEYNSKQQLELLYEVRKKEIEKLSEQLAQLQLEKEEEKHELTRQLYATQAELNGANVSRDQLQNALVDAKAQIRDFQSQVTTLKEKIAVLEKTNENMSGELSIARNSVDDLQKKISILERVQSLQSNDKTHEKFLKQAQDKHAIEMRNMQTQIDILTTKLNEKESSYVTLELKLADMRRANETLMVEKGDTMNRLAQALEESQAQCRNLMATNSAREVMELQSRVKILSQEKNELLKTMDELKHQLEIAKVDMIQYDSLLAATGDDETDSIRQMKLGELHNNIASKKGEDITSRLRGELHRCIAGQTVKRKEIARLESILEQKDKDLEKAYAMADTCRQEASQYVKRVHELEQELKSVITEQSAKAKTQIKRLSDHLIEVRSQKETLAHEKHELQQKLDETLANQEDTIRRLHQETIAQYEKETTAEYNKEYLEIHDKAVERVRHEAQLERVQLEVQLEQTQKELDQVKEMYIDVCGSKEQLINEHKNEIKMLKETYLNFNAQKHDVDQLKMDLEVQKKIARNFSQECESQTKKVIELEKDLSYERKKRAEYTKKIHEEIERAKEQALAELRNAHPESQISLLLPDHCTEHSDKIAQLEDDCRRLEGKLSIAVEEQRKMSTLQTELDDTKIKIAQMEITQESLKKKYDNLLNEKNDLLYKLSLKDNEIMSLKKNCEIRDKDEFNISAQMKSHNESLKAQCDSLLKDRSEYKTKISELETKLTDCRKKVMYLEKNLSRSGENLSTSRNDLERELHHYKDLVKSLAGQVNTNKDQKKSDYFPEEKIKQLELELKEKEAQLRRLNDLDKIQEERDALVTKLKNQAKQFEQFVKSQKQISAELNLSPRTSIEGEEIQKIREMSVKVVREEMELKLAEQLRHIEDQHREKQKSIEQNYKSVLKSLKSEMEAMKDAMMVEVSEKQKLQSSFKAQEQIVTQMVEAKLNECKEELLAHKLKIGQLQTQLKEKERDVEEKKNLMSQYMSKWVPEVQSMNLIKAKMQEEINHLRRDEDKYKEEINQFKHKQQELKNIIDTLQERYRSAKKTARNYKELAERKEQHAISECKRIEEGCKKAVSQVQQEREEMQKQVEEKIKELEGQYETKLRQLRLKIKYKDKS